MISRQSIAEVCISAKPVAHGMQRRLICGADAGKGIDFPVLKESSGGPRRIIISIKTDTYINCVSRQNAGREILGNSNL